MDARPVESAPAKVYKCSHCLNESKHHLYKVKGGIGFGNPITQKIWISSSTEWIMVCEICENYSQVTKSEADSIQNVKSQNNTTVNAPPRKAKLSSDQVAKQTHNKKKPTQAKIRSSQCVKCNSELSVQAKFCGKCGVRV